MMLIYISIDLPADGCFMMLWRQFAMFQFLSMENISIRSPQIFLKMTFRWKMFFCGCMWMYKDYNIPGIARVFMQIREKMIEGVTSAVYYESKTLEILSLISQRHRLKQQHNYENTYLTISQKELYILKNVGKVIRQTPMCPPSIEELCKISAMSQTKLRELFKKVQGIPLGKYIQQCKLEHSLVLLSGNSLSIAEIAEKLGYANTSFSAAFKKTV